MPSTNFLVTETRFFESKLPELVKSDVGRFVLIKGEEIKGVFESQLDAIKAGYEQFKGDAFFVTQILPVRQPLDFSNNFFHV